VDNSRSGPDPAPACASTPASPCPDPPDLPRDRRDDPGRGRRRSAAHPQGGSLLSPSVTRRVIEQFVTRWTRTGVPREDLARLTEREQEILGWVATGRSNDEIAAALVVSPATVRTHVSRAMVKLNARDRAQLVVFAIQSGLTMPD
jgi:DNA-binding NarL/FixJ family response regulator